MERGTGIEPVALAWEARVLPLYEPRASGADSSSAGLDQKDIAFNGKAAEKEAA